MVRVLVVDDDLCILQVAKTILERSGFRTLCADNGLDALRLFQTHEIDVLLTNIVMPGMCELIVKARKRHPNLPVCCMTAYIPLVTDLEGELIISKPFTPRRLISAVRQVLKTRRQRGTHTGTPSSVSLSRRTKSANTRSKRFHSAPLSAHISVVVS
jgi:DNA-binding NtrC family response regulator